MSLHELSVLWPAYYQTKAWLEKQLKDVEGTVPPEQFDREYERTMGGGG